MNMYLLRKINRFETVGKLIGISLRTNHYLPFLLPSIIWKKLVDKKIDIYDLQDIDTEFVKLLNSKTNFIN